MDYHSLIKSTSAIMSEAPISLQSQYLHLCKSSLANVFLLPLPTVDASPTLIHALTQVHNLNLITHWLTTLPLPILIPYLHEISTCQTNSHWKNHLNLLVPFLARITSSDELVLKASMDALQSIIGAVLAQSDFDTYWEDLSVSSEYHIPLTPSSEFFAAILALTTSLIPTCITIKLRIVCAINLSQDLTYLVADMENVLQKIEDQSECLDLVLVSFEGLGVISKHCETVKSQVVSYLDKFLIKDPDRIFNWLDGEACQIVRECGSGVLTGCLSGSGDIKAILFGAINALYNNDNQTRYENSISLISYLTTILPPSVTVEIAIPALVRKLSDKPYEKQVWHSLASIGMTTDLSIFKTVLSFVLASVEGEIPRRIAHTLARMERPVELMQLYLERVLTLFLEKCGVLHKTGDTSLLKGLRGLLTLVRLLFESATLSRNITSSLSHQLRNMWFYLVLFVLLPDGSWPVEWYGVVKIVARTSPPLTLDANVPSLDVNLTSDSVLVSTFPESIHAKIKPLLINYLPLLAVEIRNLSWPTCVYFVSVYQIELLRMKNLSLDFLCNYLADPRLQAVGLYEVAKGIAESVLMQGLGNSMYKKLPCVVVEDHLKTLIRFAAFRLKRMRQFVRVWVVKVLSVTPMMLFHGPSLSFMFDLLRHLDTLFTSNLKSNLIAIDGMEYIDRLEVEEAIDDLYDLANEWVEAAMKVSPKVIIPLIQTYVQENFMAESPLMELIQRLISREESSVFKYSSHRVNYLGIVQGMLVYENIKVVSKRVCKELKEILKSDDLDYAILNGCMSRAASVVILNEAVVETELILMICQAPKKHFTKQVVEMMLETVSWIMTCNQDFSVRILGHLSQLWESIAINKVGIYCGGSTSSILMSYGAPAELVGNDKCLGHLEFIKFWSERFQYYRLVGEEYVSLYSQFITMALGFDLSSSSESYLVRIELGILGVLVAKDLSRRQSKSGLFVWMVVFRLCLNLFTSRPNFNLVTVQVLSKLVSLKDLISNLKLEKIQTSLTTLMLKSAFIAFSDRVEFEDIQCLLMLLLKDEILRFQTFLHPLQSIPKEPNNARLDWVKIVKTAWRSNPRVATQLVTRFNCDVIRVELAKLSQNGLIKVDYLQGNSRHLLYWKAVPPIVAIQILCKVEELQPWVIQYGIRSLEHYSITEVFFFIPQLVQALRYDKLGYIERYILEAAKSSSYFAHQIIWNINANLVDLALQESFKRIIYHIVQSLVGSEKDFYEREFSFFKEITDISGSLKPLVESGASKQEKKKMIDEELKKVKVEVGVYLPTNVDKVVVDIDYGSGRPLQSHAKAPFMATFKVSKGEKFEWISSIFKVGDDCRQDMLALQLISVFQSIYTSAGLGLYTFPYKVVATAPGCGVIEVIPNSISRDMMGREKVNSLFDWFKAQFGNEHSITYKKAQTEFVKSLSAYSVIMFILQIKDRHNGNIMFDLQGHMIHIDFGFMLSIAPGGGIFEVAPFKLTTEMILVMGGSITTPSYILFSSLCIKAYLSIRLHAEKIIAVVQLMQESGLPCFKGEMTVRRLRERFMLDKSERQAADFMAACIRQSHENTRAGMYDRFQFLQNGIPF